MKTLIMTASLMMGLTAFAQAPAGGEGAKKMHAAREAVNAACAQDAATAGCGDAKFGTGLMKCLQEYKKTHKDFQLSDACKAARGQAHEDRKEVRAERKAKKDAKKEEKKDK